MTRRKPNNSEIERVANRVREIVAELHTMPIGEGDTTKARALAAELAQLSTSAPDVVPNTVAQANGQMLRVVRSVASEPNPDQALIDVAMHFNVAADRLREGRGTDADRELLRLGARALAGLPQYPDLRLDKNVPLTWFVHASVTEARTKHLGAAWLARQCTRVDARFAIVPASEWEAAASGAPSPGKVARRPPDLLRAAFIVLTALGEGEGVGRWDVAKDLQERASTERSERGA